MTVAKTAVLVAAATLVVALAVRHYFTGHQVPREQPPLADLATASLGSLRGDFNHASDQMRIVLLLSPS
jgi:hypothetical protein